MLTCTAKFLVQAGTEEEFERVLRMMVPKVREEPGNYAYILHRSRHDPCVFMLYEAYEDQAALEAHRAHLRDLDIDLQAMLAAPPVFECYERLL